LAILGCDVLKKISREVSFVLAICAMSEKEGAVAPPRVAPPALIAWQPTHQVFAVNSPLAASCAKVCPTSTQLAKKIETIAKALHRPDGQVGLPIQLGISPVPAIGGQNLFSNSQLSSNYLAMN
jgi:hypothetical protein